jgi:hypothetical protein
VRNWNTCLVFHEWDQEKARLIAAIHLFVVCPVEEFSSIPLALNLAVCGTLGSLLLLGVEYFGGMRRTALAALALAGMSLTGAAGLYAVGMTREWTWPLAALGALAVAGSSLGSDRVRDLITRTFIRPAGLFTLVLATGIAATFYVTWGSKPEDNIANLAFHESVGYHMLPELVGVTDAGRELPLCAYDDSPAFDRQELSVIDLAQYEHQIIRIAEPSPRSNCHGWVYFNGQYAVRSRDVDTILTDNGYSEIDRPAAGDLAIYRNSAREITHTAIVRMVREDGAVFCESKWGPLGVYLHPVAVQPYGPDFHYYRSERNGHQVTVLPATSREADSSPLALDDGPLDPLPLISTAHTKPARRQVYERPTLRVPGQRRT